MREYQHYNNLNLITMKNKILLFALLLLSGLGFAVSAAWLVSELWSALDLAYQFDFKSVPTFAISLGIYGSFNVMYYGKSKYKPRVKAYHYCKDYYITSDSQIPTKL